MQGRSRSNRKPAWWVGSSLLVFLRLGGAWGHAAVQRLDVAAVAMPQPRLRYVEFQTVAGLVGQPLQHAGRSLGSRPTRTGGVLRRRPPAQGRAQHEHSCHRRRTGPPVAERQGLREHPPQHPRQPGHRMRLRAEQRLFRRERLLALLTRSSGPEGQSSPCRLPGLRRLELAGISIDAPAAVREQSA